MATTVYGVFVTDHDGDMDDINVLRHVFSSIRLANDYADKLEAEEENISIDVQPLPVFDVLPS